MRKNRKDTPQTNGGNKITNYFSLKRITNSTRVKPNPERKNEKKTKEKKKDDYH